MILAFLGWVVWTLGALTLAALLFAVVLFALFVGALIALDRGWLDWLD